MSLSEIKKIREKYAWFVERGQCGIVEKSSNGQWVTITEVKPIRMYSTKLADPLTGVTTDEHNHLEEEPEVPNQFHMGIVNKAISDLYKTPNSMNLEAAQVFELEYLKSVKRAKKFAKRRHTGFGRIVGVDF